MKRGKKLRYAKNPVFDNELHNEVVTYSKSTTMRLIYISRILSIESTILDKQVQKLSNLRQSEKRLHPKDKIFPFSVQKTGDFASDPTL